MRFAGVAGPLDAGAGDGKSLFPMEELSVMGIAEVLPKYLHLKRRIREVAEAAIASEAEGAGHHRLPRFRAARGGLGQGGKARDADDPLRGPFVWAWRPGRAAKMARHVDHVLALLPFEPPYMTAAGMTCDFVGHPVVAEPLANAAERAVPLMARGHWFWPCPDRGGAR
jgi:lipid-A-disaccharide synthase